MTDEQYKQMMELYCAKTVQDAHVLARDLTHEHFKDKVILEVASHLKHGMNAYHLWIVFGKDSVSREKYSADIAQAVAESLKEILTSMRSEYIAAGDLLTEIWGARQEGLPFGPIVQPPNPCDNPPEMDGEVENWMRLRLV